LIKPDELGAISNFPVLGWPLLGCGRPSSRAFLIRMELTWIDPAHLDERDVDGAVALMAAAQAVDSPSAAPSTRAGFLAGIRHGWDGDPALVGVRRDKRCRVVGVVEIGFSSWDNTHLGSAEVTVDPEARGQGLGRQLLEAGIDRVRAEGKRLVLTESHNAPAALALGAALGFERAMTGLKRRQDLVALDWPALDRDYALAVAAAPSFELLHLEGPTPEDLLDDVVTMTAAINDAPIDALEVEDEVFSPERIRAFERGQQERGRRIYRVVARERTTGELAGHTMVSVDKDSPGFGGQFDTSVMRAHRGHQLGLLLKIEMLRWLGHAEPQLRVLDTWNAASNAHMIAVNEQLGYRVIDQGIEWQKHL
jgi:Sortase and related acyltransferases